MQIEEPCRLRAKSIKKHGEKRYRTSQET
uniref:Uncharacterized protein n=1 Tax=Arundo donax TaxID=35708 RepID=A0A0A8Z8E1_ARUDO